jgi:Protein of unknown function (DUF3106)
MAADGTRASRRAVARRARLAASGALPAILAGVAVLLLVRSAPANEGGGIRRVQTWEQLSPDQRKRAVENFQRYQRLPKASQQRLEERYDRFRELQPAERERVRRNYEVYRQMTPSQKQDLNDRYRRWKGGKE